MAYGEHKGSKVHVQPTCLAQLARVCLPQVSFLTYKTETLQSGLGRLLRLFWGWGLIPGL